MIFVLSIEESPTVGRQQGFQIWNRFVSGFQMRKAILQHLVPSSSSQYHIQRCLGTFDRNSESEKSKGGPTGCPVILVPIRGSAEERDTSTSIIPTEGKARSIPKIKVRGVIK